METNSHKSNSWAEYIASDEYKNHLENIEELKSKNKKEAEDFFNNLSYENKLLCFFHVVSCIYEAELEDNGTYRYLLYNKMGFNEESYGLGMDFGLLSLHNAIYTEEELYKGLVNVLEYLEIKFDHNLSSKCFDILKYGYQKFQDRDNLQLEFNFDN